MSDFIPTLVSIGLFIITLFLLYVNFNKSGFCFSCSFHIELTNKPEVVDALCITQSNEQTADTTDPSL